jgi:putative transcriptional regulator
MDYNLKTFGKLIKIERIRKDFSQEMLAEKVGVSTRTISLIESGLQHPKFFLVCKIAKVLDFDISILT